MIPQECLDAIKNDAQVGEPGNNNDVAAADITRRMNNAMFRVWRYGPWDWSLIPVAFTLAAGVSDYTFDATIGEIVGLGIGGQRGMLKRYSYREYRERVLEPGIDPSNNQPITQSGQPKGYYSLGRVADGAGILNLKIRFVLTPIGAVNIEGFGKGRITKMAAAALPATFPYFPEEYTDLVYDYAYAMTLIAGKDVRGAGFLGQAEAELKRLWGEAQPQDDEPTAEVPDMIFFRNRRRGGTKNL